MSEFRSFIYRNSDTDDVPGFDILIPPTPQGEIKNTEVLNLSAKILSNEHFSLLSHGLSFSPSVNFDLLRMILDINKFARNITIRKHFEDFAKNANYLR